jgi:hypothetical protein
MYLIWKKLLFRLEIKWGAVLVPQQIHAGVVTINRDLSPSRLQERSRSCGSG